MIQEIFATAFVELQTEMAEAIARESSADPLSALTSIDREKKKRKVSMFARDMARGNVVVQKNVEDDEYHKSGGFIRQKQVPEKILNLQKAQKKWLASPRFVDDTSDSKIGNIRTSFEHRKDNYRITSRKKVKKVSYWSIGDEEKNSSEQNNLSLDFLKKSDVDNDLECSCGSKTVEIESNTAGRNDIIKGETWGNKNTPDAFQRCICRNCGKTWNNE